MIAESGLVPRSRLADLAQCAGVTLVGESVGDLEVVDLAYDSRQVTPGSLFACIRGSQVDGHDHAAAAVAAGAVAVVTERPLDLGVPELRVPDARVALAPLAACFFGHPAESMTVVGVTGTNGKTTVVHLLASIFEAAGRRSATIGTLSGGYSTPTTPEAPDLQRHLRRLVDDGVQAVAIEVSSHALALHRVDSTMVDLAVFTNLSRDHLDFHRTMEEYFAAKARLFTPEHAREAVVNLDDPHGRLLLDAATISTIGYRLGDVTDLELHLDHTTFVWNGLPVTLPLVGRVNVANALAAATAAHRLGVETEAIARGLSTVQPVRGRFERVVVDAPFAVMVDYAHTPDALAQLLETSGELVRRGGPDRRVVLVVGCGGDKDRTKRAPMGEVAARLADQVVLTSDNPRSEDPVAIIEAMRSGMHTTGHVEVEPDRRRAIGHALSVARSGDLVVIAGKGHETEQVVGGDSVPFDDRVVAAEEWSRIAEPPTQGPRS